MLIGNFSQLETSPEVCLRKGNGLYQKHTVYSCYLKICLLVDDLLYSKWLRLLLSFLNFCKLCFLLFPSCFLGGWLCLGWNNKDIRSCLSYCACLKHTTLVRNKEHWLKNYLTGNKLTIDNIVIMLLCAIQISNSKNLPWTCFETADKDFGSPFNPDT